MLRKLYAIPVICVLMLTGCQSKNVLTGNGGNETDNTFVMLKNEGSEAEGNVVSEVYVKYEGKDKDKIASDIPAYNQIEYLEGKKSILIQDDENNLVKYDSDGEKETIGKNLISSDESGIPYKVSSNNETVVYLTDDESLYIKEKDKDKDKVSSDVSNYNIDSTGKYVYYTNNDSDLYVYVDGESEKISSDVLDFTISTNGDTVVFLNNEEELYIKTIDSDDKEKITSEKVNMSSVKIYEDGIITFLSDFDYEDDKGELYIYNSKEKDNANEKVKVASDVKHYIRKNDKFYFINEEGTLYEKTLNDEKSNKLLSDVEYMRNKSDGIVYINKDGNIYSKKDNQEADKIGKNIKSKEFLNIANGKEIIYLTENDDLFAGNQKIAKEVSNYVYNSNVIAYVTKNKEVHSYNLKDKTDKVEISDAKEYSYIYLEDQLVFSNLLEPYELAGYWNVTPEYGESNYVLEFIGNNKMVLYYSDDEKYTTTYKVDSNYEKLMYINTTDQDSIRIEKKDDKNIKILWDEDNEDSATKISKVEADKMLKKELSSYENIEQKDNTYSEQLGSAEDRIKDLIENYEYGYVEAINAGDASLVNDYLVYNGKLYNEHANNVYAFYEKGISETLYDSKVTGIEKVNDKEYRVKVHEKIGVIKNGSEEIKEYDSTYIVVDQDGEFLIREMI